MLLFIIFSIICSGILVDQTKGKPFNQAIVNVEANQDDSCGSLTSCSSCLDDGNDCQWCPGTGLCQNSKAICIPNELNGTTITDSSDCACVNPTATFTNCSSCIGNCDGFGWCPTEGKCYYGNGYEPLNHTCIGNDTSGVWSDNQCDAMEPTKRYQNCTACLSIDDLGWCPTENKCYFGGSHGPLNHTCLGSDAQGVWSTYRVSDCLEVDPVTKYTNCSSCVKNYDLGWCPHEEKCYYGTDQNPMNHTCLANGTAGLWQFGGCETLNPTTRFLNCTSCNKYYDILGWCPSEGKCYAGDDNAPYNHTCKPDVNSGVFTHSCKCSYPFLIDDESTCDFCSDQPFNFTWCHYSEECYSAIGNLNFKDLCSTQECPPNCLCEPGTSECVLCRRGFSDTQSGCTKKCAPNCFDCHPNNSSMCLSACANGFSGFPECKDFCPSFCTSCAGGFNISAYNTSIALKPESCIQCSDPGAIPPLCNECYDGVCKGVSGTCSVPCKTLFHDTNNDQQSMHLVGYIGGFRIL